MSTRRSFLGKLLALPIAAKVAPLLPEIAPAVAAVPTLVATPAVPVGLVTFASVIAHAQNVGILAEGGDLPSLIHRMTRKAFYNPSDKPQHFAVGGHLHTIAPGKAAYVKEGSLIPCSPPQGIEHGSMKPYPAPVDWKPS